MHYYGEATPVEFVNVLRSALAVPPQRDAGTVTRLRMLACGGDYVESLRSQAFAEMIPEACCAVGVHPHQAAEYLANRADFRIFRDKPKVVAIGELGLDYYYETSAPCAQQQVLEEFLDLALEWDLPAVIHLRDKDGAEQVYEDAYRLLEAFARRGGRFEIHSFAGTPGWAERFLALGAYCGVNGMVTFKRADNIRAGLQAIPLERLLLETDSPYLAPVPHRGEQNHPGFLPLIAARTAAEKGVSTEELAQITTANGMLFFRLPETEKEA